MTITVSVLVLASIYISLATVNPYNFTKIIETTPCEPEDKLLIVVHSSVQTLYTRRRVVLRSTWLNPQTLDNKLGMKIKVVFFLGSSTNETTQERVAYESEEFGDIVQSSFIDHYRNNTYKVMSYLLWTSENCAGATLLMKIDDDLLLHEKRTDRLKVLIRKWTSTLEYMYIGKGMDRRPHRHLSSKWYVPYDVYPNELYPLWFQGLVYFLSPGMTGSLFKIALNTPYLFTDDVYVGILVDKLKDSVNITRTPINDLSEYSDIYSGDWKKRLERSWNKGKQVLFHVPNFTTYWEWHSSVVNIDKTINY